MKTFLCLLATVTGAGCATVQPVLPDGAHGYQCYRSETVGAAVVSAEAYPDYRGGYASLTMSWMAETTGPDSWKAQMHWTAGPRAISPPGWLDVHRSVPVLPPLHSKIRLQLSSGESVERAFVDEKIWRQWNGFRAAAYGGVIPVREPRIMAAFAAADWADVSVLDPAGGLIASTRIDLTQLPTALAAMRHLGEQVKADVGDYTRRCGAIHIEVN